MVALSCESLHVLLLLFGITAMIVSATSTSFMLHSIAFAVHSSCRQHREQTNDSEMKINVATSNPLPSLPLSQIGGDGVGNSA